MKPLLTLDLAPQSRRWIRRRRTLIWLGAAACTAIAGVAFAVLTPSQVLRGTEAIAARVPWQYQVCVFPAFGLFVSEAGLDALTSKPRVWIVRATLSVVLVVAGLARLGALVAVSGHALCLSCLLVWAASCRDRGEARWLALLAAPALALTGWYKLAIWRDALWFFASLGVGVALGVAAAWAQRRVSRAA